MATLSIVEDKATVHFGNNKLELYQTDPNCWELVFEEYQTLEVRELKIRELKALNEVGFVYHSEQTNIDYENEDGTTSYMDIFYFALVENTQELFQNCVPF